MKMPKDAYSVRRYEDLAFAVAHYGTSYHRQFWDLCVDAGFNKKQIFTKYMKILRDLSHVNHSILKAVDLGYHSILSFQADKKSV
jgi:hypothetical protein